jgi:citrate lyase subunit beta/citryl-CoA lyase
MRKDPPGTAWHSALFVPAKDQARIAKLGLRNADLAILDLEDAIAPQDKDSARAAVPSAVAALAAQGQAVAVRVNGEMPMMAADLDAAIRQGLDAVVLPKTEHRAQLTSLSDMIGARETAQGLDPGGISVIALIETPKALRHLPHIANSPRVCAIALGSEDFSVSLGAEPSFDALDLPARLIALAAAAYGLSSFALPFSIADFSDLAGFEQAARKARAFGATGGLCIHPSQIEVVNRVFAPAEAELERARALMTAWIDAGRPAVLTLNGRMVDRPVILRAARLLNLAL